MPIFLKLLTLSVTFCVLSAHAQQAGRGVRALPDDNLAYPVLIKLSNDRTGSGFYLNTVDSIYLVTAKHVLVNSKTKELFATSFELHSYSKDIADEIPNTISIDAGKLATGSIVAHPTQDVIVINLFAADKADSGRIRPRPGVTVRQSARTGLLGVAIENTKTFGEVLVGNDVYLFGYPTSLALQSSPEVEVNRPLLRRGIIAGKNPRTKSLILDCPVYFGNSGGPVVEVDDYGLKRHYAVIGVASKYVPYSDGSRTFAILANSGYSVAVPMDFVFELIK